LPNDSTTVHDTPRCRDLQYCGTVQVASKFQRAESTRTTR